MINAPFTVAAAFEGMNLVFAGAGGLFLILTLAFVFLFIRERSGQRMRPIAKRGKR